MWILAHAPFADDQSALFGACGATFQIDFTYHNRKSLVGRTGLEPITRRLNLVLVICTPKGLVTFEP